MDKLSSNVDYQFCNRKVKKSRYLNDLRDTHEYADDRILKLIACPVFECETKCINNLLKTLKFIRKKFMFFISIIDVIVKGKWACQLRRRDSDPSIVYFIRRLQRTFNRTVVRTIAILPHRRNLDEKCKILVGTELGKQFFEQMMLLIS
uniref:RNA-directed DNA polymerase-like protein n=1 Tax=Strongyloides venezuelensis TaxID=75913 RepID=A0A0K0EX31_STRVS